jgi:hypothetical protein
MAKAYENQSGDKGRQYEHKGIAGQ